MKEGEIVFESPPSDNFQEQSFFPKHMQFIDSVLDFGKVTRLDLKEEFQEIPLMKPLAKLSNLKVFTLHTLSESPTSLRGRSAQSDCRQLLSDRRGVDELVGLLFFP